MRQFPNYGYLLVDLEDLSPVQKEIESLSSLRSISDIVDGHVTSTYALKESLSFLESITLPHFWDYNTKTNYLERNYRCLTDNQEVVMNDAWVSFQHKHEFNPAHTHPGLASFVIWLSIPYSRVEEKVMSPGSSPRNKSGSFTMYYSSILGNVETEDILLDESFNNKMILFPSKIKHSVQPFYSTDSVRVSVAGNFYFKTP